jgi:hypothetical protein
MEPLFDYEKLDVYRVELAFIAWIADFLGDVAQRGRRCSAGQPVEGSPSHIALLLASSFQKPPIFSVLAAHAAPFSTLLVTPA